MDPLAVYARWLPKKLTVLDQSLAKIENGGSACFSLQRANASVTRSVADYFRSRLSQPLTTCESEAPSIRTPQLCSKLSLARWPKAAARASDAAGATRLRRVLSVIYGCNICAPGTMKNECLSMRELQGSAVATTSRSE